MILTTKELEWLEHKQGQHDLCPDPELCTGCKLLKLILRYRVIHGQLISDIKQALEEAVV